MTMKFEWNETKSQQCFEQRGFDFAYAAKAFFDSERKIEEDKRRDYGEKRYRLLGRIDGRLYAIAYTLRAESIRLISARKANLREVKTYENNLFGN